MCQSLSWCSMNAGTLPFPWACPQWSAEYPYVIMPECGFLHQKFCRKTWIFEQKYPKPLIELVNKGRKILVGWFGLVSSQKWGRVLEIWCIQDYCFQGECVHSLSGINLTPFEMNRNYLIDSISATSGSVYYTRTHTVLKA